MRPDGRCDICWQSHGCGLPAGHDGPCLCKPDDPDGPCCAHDGTAMWDVLDDGTLTAPRTAYRYRAGNLPVWWAMTEGEL